MDKKIFWFDCETTGIDHKLHDIIQIAFIVEINGEMEAQYKFNIQPFSYETIEPSALEVNGFTIEQIKEFMPPREAYRQILSVIDQYVDRYDKQDKFYPAGYNVGFDYDFFMEFFRKNGDNYFGSFFNHRKIDPLPMLYSLDYHGIIEYKNYKLTTVCENMNIIINDAHDALNDVIATRKVYFKTLDLMRKLKVFTV